MELIIVEIKETKEIVQSFNADGLELLVQTAQNAFYTRNCVTGRMIVGINLTRVCVRGMK